MARADWKRYYTPIFDQPFIHRKIRWFRMRCNAIAYGNVTAIMSDHAGHPVRLIGIAAVRGKEPDVQKWFVENISDRFTLTFR